MIRILSGIQPSGTLHLGNYFGMMRPAIALQEEGEAFYFIADYHALTTVQDRTKLRWISWPVVWTRRGRVSSSRATCRWSRNSPGFSAP